MLVRKLSYAYELATPPLRPPRPSSPSPIPPGIGKFAVKAFLDITGRLNGKIVAVACLEAPTMEETAHVVGEASGRSSVRAEFLSDEDFQAPRAAIRPLRSQWRARDE
jgi:hypothetical protein